MSSSPTAAMQQMRKAATAVAVLASGAMAQNIIPLGCNSIDASLFTETPGILIENTAAVCATYCWNLDKNLSATQDVYCYCGTQDFVITELDPGLCDIPCPGDEAETCGGVDPDPASSEPYFNVYALFAEGSGTTTTTDTATTAATATTTDTAAATTTTTDATTTAANTTTASTDTASVDRTLVDTTTASTTGTGEVLPGTMTVTETTLQTTTSCTGAGGCTGVASPTPVPDDCPPGWKVFIEVIIVAEPGCGGPYVDGEGGDREGGCRGGAHKTTAAPHTSVHYYNPEESTTTVYVENGITKTILVPITKVAVVTNAPHQPYPQHSGYENTGYGHANKTASPPIVAGAAGGFGGVGLLVTVGAAAVGAMML